MRPVRSFALVELLFLTSCLYGASIPKVAGPGEPFNTFRSLDAQLSVLDQHMSELKREAEKVGKIHDSKARTKAYKNLRRSKAVREVRSTIWSIEATARAVGYNRRIRNSRYGREISSALRRKAMRMNQRLDRFRYAKTSQGTDASLRDFSQSMIAFVLQFQAVSGGYGALQCGPGSWTCCRPKKVGGKGAALNGCRWVCVETARRCRSGCLGPRTPMATRAPQERPERRLTAARPPRSP